MSKPTTKTRRRYTQLSVKLVSGVDVPAQEGAVVAITKRATMVQLVDTSKKATLTSAESGHSHLVRDIELESGTTDGASMGVGTDGYGTGYHYHPWIRAADGTYTIGMVFGHTHEMLIGDLSPALADDVGKRAAPPTIPTATPTPAPAPIPTPTPTEKKQEPTMTTEEQARLDRAEARATMTDAQKRHHDRLSGAEAVTFAKMAPAERQAAVDADKVVYVAKHGGMKGREFRASEELGDACTFAKTLDVEIEKRLEAEKRAQRVSLEKRAETELGNFGGTLEERTELLEVIEAGAALLGVKPEKAARFAEIVKGANAAAAIASKRLGTHVDPTKGATPHVAFNTALVEFAKAAGKTPEAATADFLQTDAGAALYDATLEQN